MKTIGRVDVPQEAFVAALSTTGTDKSKKWPSRLRPTGPEAPPAAGRCPRARPVRRDSAPV